MTTQITTRNLVRSDVTTQDPAVERPATSRSWALAGLGAGVAGVATIVLTSAVDVVYREEFAGTTAGMAAELEEKAPFMFAFHSVAMAGAVLTLVFAAGLHRRLRHALGSDSIAPVLALLGLAGSAFVSVMGAGLDTEFMMPSAAADGVIDDATFAMYNHWIGTIPWLMVLTGVAGLALWSASRRGGVPRWIGRVGLVLGGLTVAFGISPLEYISGATASLMLLAVSTGFLVGDRAHRGVR